MAFDQATRNRLARFVSDVRSLLTEEFTRQLQNEYGLDPASGEITTIEKLTALDDARRETAQILRETLEYYLAGKPTDAKARKETLERILREQAFTVLNRLCALRMAEARGLILEAVAQGYRSKGYQLYARLAGSALGETGEAYRVYLFSLFDELAVELPPLFDRFNPQGRLFPREVALLRLLELLNDPELETLWAEDETVGWIYQYFNSKEERKAMRDASQAPRNSRELAVRNQFFTPRYVVEFLTDNTLGRTWYEMTGGQTGLKDSCRYLVRRSNEIFLAEGEEVPAQVEPDTDLSQEELLKQPVYIPSRLLKDPRDIKMLDPACGSLHFGLYSFDLYELIYAEAWDIEAARGQETFVRSPGLKSLHETYRNKDAFLRDVPRMIIEHNIHGIDIDPRAVQIAGLSLWLRAQKSWQAQGIRLQDRPQIRKSNIVCAEPMPGDRQMLEEFLATLQEERLEVLLHQAAQAEPGPRLRATRTMADALAKLVRTVWQEMELAGEAGSLLKIEGTLRDAIAAARKESEEKAPLFRLLEFGLHETPETQTAQSKDGQAQDFWDQAEGLALAALQEYTEQAVNGHSFRRRLFAGDAAQGFAFIDLCRKRYDVILMNPPFGSTTVNTVDYLLKSYPNTKNDLYATFVERGILLLSESALLGAITGRNGFVHSAIASWRSYLLNYHSLLTVADLGLGVLDNAFVETAAYIVRSGCLMNDLIAFIDARNEESKKQFLLDSVLDLNKNLRRADTFLHSPVFFKGLPKSPFIYRATNRIRSLFIGGKRFEGNVGNARLGLRTLDDYRYIRLRWEVPYKNIGWEKRWVILNKGGAYGRFYFDFHLLIDWGNNGSVIKTMALEKYGSISRTIQAQSFYGRPGFTYPRRSMKGFSVRAFPSQGVFTDKGTSIFLNPNNDPYLWLGLLNSTLVSACVELQSGSSSYEVGYIQNLPAQLIVSGMDEIIGNVKNILKLKQKYSSLDFTSSNFYLPWIDNKPGELKAISKQVCEFDSLCKLEEKKVIDIVDSFVSKTLGLTQDDSLAIKDILFQRKKPNEIFDREDHIDQDDQYDLKNDNDPVLEYCLGCSFGYWDVRNATTEKFAPKSPDPFAPLPACPPGMLQNAQGLPASPDDVPADYPLRITWGGILLDDEGQSEDVEGRVREALQVIWGERAETIEAEACQILCVRSLREYFQKPGGYFADHLKRYSKSRRAAPIYWPLATPSGSYTLWLYYHRLTDQTLFSCVNDFVDPKLKQVSAESARLRQKKGRSAADEKELERLTDLERELKDFRAELMRVAAFWKPNLNDGVEITAAPLYRLFQYKPWQKRLKETWGKLEAGDYDWAHLAHSIWPERVREKCKSDKSLAIAHDLEHLYIESKTSAKKKAGRKKIEGPEMEGFSDED